MNISNRLVNLARKLALVWRGILGKVKKVSAYLTNLALLILLAFLLILVILVIQADQNFPYHLVHLADPGLLFLALPCYQNFLIVQGHHDHLIHGITNTLVCITATGYILNSTSHQHIKCFTNLMSP